MFSKYPGQGGSESRESPRNTQCELRIHPGSDTSPAGTIHTQFHTNLQFSQANLPKGYIFGRPEETREPRQNRTPHRQKLPK